MKVLISILLIITSLSLTAQYKLSGRVEGYMRIDINICTQFGDESKLVETVKTDLNGAFSYNLSSYEKGLYRIYLDNEDYFDLILNDENVDISTRIENPAYNMQVLSSEENKQFYSYIVENYIFDYKIDVLNQLTEIYPDGKFRRKAVTELNRETKLKNNNINKVIRQNSSSFAGRYLMYLKEIPVPQKFNEAEKIEYLRKEYLNHFKFNDTTLINSNAYQTVVLNYFKLFRSNDQETYYQAGKDVLDYIFFEDPKIMNAVFEYILSGFESLGLDEAAARLSLEYGDVCSDGDESLKMRIKSNTELSVGKIAPDFEIMSTRGDLIKLSQMESDYTLIVFWATWCEHCQVSLPRLAASMSIFNQAKIDILAVSIDSDKEVLANYLVDNPLPWDVVCEYKGWDGDIVINYAVFATPTMYLIDKNMKIVAKPYNEERLYNELEKILTEKM